VRVQFPPRAPSSAVSGNVCAFDEGSEVLVSGVSVALADVTIRFMLDVLAPVGVFQFGDWLR